MDRLSWWLGPARLASASPPLVGLGMRPIAFADHDFLCSLYVSTRLHEVAATGWPDIESKRFLEQQFEFQHRYYQEHYVAADFLLLTRDTRPVGRLYWWESDRQGGRGEHRASLIDMSLLADERGRGVGSALLSLMVDHADRAGRVVELHVEATNPALRLYRRFGFEPVGGNHVYVKMRRNARASDSTPVEETAP